MEKNEQNIIEILCEELNIKKWQAENVIGLIDDGNTVPFIARYRKEATGAMDDIQLRDFHKRLMALRSLEEKRADIIRLIDEQGKLTDELRAEIETAKTVSELNDIYRPYRPKRRTRASVAKEKGLAPLAEIIFAQLPDTDPIDEASKYIDAEKGVADIDEALAGAMDIIAEDISDNADIRKALREKTEKFGILTTKNATDEESVYSTYYEFSQKIADVPPHRLLAINRGEKEGFLSVKLETDEDNMIGFIIRKTTPKTPAPTTQYVELAGADAYKRLIAPSLATELRNDATERAEDSSIKVFGKNLNGLLMQPPVKGKRVMGFDPGYRTGCKVAVVDDTGKVLDTGVVYCTLPNHDKEKAEKIIKEMLIKNDVDIVSIGNGTASKESEIFISELIKTMDKSIYYVMTNEAGASVYSASELATAEFPEYDVALRSAVSIARRLQDPLAELVKIDPKSIGVGQYQHDMNPTKLSTELGGVVEDCVNHVGVDLNTASPSLLGYVSGVNKTVAQNITAYREENGKFNKRSELLNVPKLGKKAFEQCAGFLRISDGTDFLDNTSVHPESYKATHALLKELKYTEADVTGGKLSDIRSRVEAIGKTTLAEKVGVGEMTLNDIIEALLKPGRDPREELPQPTLRKDVLSMEDLKPDMVLTGTVRNVIDFGAFVDIGVHQDGLVHISQICDRFIKHPSDALKVGDIVKVKVIEVDLKKKRISLTMRNIGE